MSASHLWMSLLWMGVAAGAETRAGHGSEPERTLLAALATGDAAFAVFNNNAALAAYDRALALDSTNFRVLYKTTLTSVLVGIPAKDPEQSQYYFRAERLGRSLTALYPDSADSHFVLAMALGRVALKAGGKKKIALAREIKTEAEQALAIAPCHDGAMHILGRWNYELSHLSWIMRSFAKIAYGGLPSSGGNEAACAWFEKASVCAPHLLVHRLWLAKTLIDMKEYARARLYLQQCLELPIAHWDDTLHKEAAAKLLAEIQNK